MRAAHLPTCLYAAKSPVRRKPPGPSTPTKKYYIVLPLRCRAPLLHPIYGLVIPSPRGKHYRQKQRPSRSANRDHGRDKKRKSLDRALPLCCQPQPSQPSPRYPTAGVESTPPTTAEGSPRAKKGGFIESGPSLDSHHAPYPPPLLPCGWRGAFGVGAMVHRDDPKACAGSTRCPAALSPHPTPLPDGAPEAPGPCGCPCPGPPPTPAPPAPAGGWRSP